MICWRSSHRARATLLAFLCLCRASAFGQDEPWPGKIEDHFRRLRASIQKDEGPVEIYALLSDLSQRVIELDKDGTARLHYDDGNGRTRDRTIPAGELAQLRRWLSEKKVEELPPYDNEGDFDGIQYEYVHLDQKGTERRVPMNNPPKTIAAASSEFGGKNPRAYGALMQRMLALDAIPIRVSYKFLENLPGFRLVHTGDKDYVTALSLRNSQLLAEVWRDNKAKTWHAVSDRGIVAARVVKPSNPLDREWWPKYLGDKYADTTEGPYAGKRLWIGTRQKDKVEGLWASGVKGAPELVVRGRFGQPIVCAGGEWVIAAKAAEGATWAAPNTVVRIHLPTRTIAPVDLPAADDFKPIRWLASHRKVLVYQLRDEHGDGVAGPKDREYYLVDPATGVCERVSGDFRPLTDYNGLPRQLQPSSEANIVWATVVDWKADRPREADTHLGKYNVHDFVFSPLLHLRGVHVDSDQMVVDEKAGEAWLLLGGDIAKVTLPVSPAGPK
jgi:hypothetical protein